MLKRELSDLRFNCASDNFFRWSLITFASFLFSHFFTSSLVSFFLIILEVGHFASIRTIKLVMKGICHFYLPALNSSLSFSAMNLVNVKFGNHAYNSACMISCLINGCLPLKFYRLQFNICFRSKCQTFIVTEVY